MTTQPEALRLAAMIERDTYPLSQFFPVAAELRRLYEAHEWQYTMAGQRLRRIEKLEASNIELLAALRDLMADNSDLSMTQHLALYRKARAAIAKAERTTT